MNSTYIQCKLELVNLTVYKESKIKPTKIVCVIKHTKNSMFPGNKKSLNLYRKLSAGSIYFHYFLHSQSIYSFFHKIFLKLNSVDGSNYRLKFVSYLLTKTFFFHLTLFGNDMDLEKNRSFMYTYCLTEMLFN